MATFDGVGTVSGTSDIASLGSTPSTPNLNAGQSFSQSSSATNGTATPGRGTINLIFYIISPPKIVLMDAAATNTSPALAIGAK